MPDHPADDPIAMCVGVRIVRKVVNDFRRRTCITVYARKLFAYRYFVDLCKGVSAGLEAAVFTQSRNEIQRTLRKSLPTFARFVLCLKSENAILQV
jgi:hypothetical protein